MILKKDFLSSLSLASALSVLVFVLCLKAYFGQDAYVQIHDNLDSSHAWLAALHQHELFFAGAETEVPILSGMERDYFMSELQLSNFIYYLFPPFEAHFVSFFLKICIGFLSFFILAREIFGYSGREQAMIPLVSAAYALLPGYENLYIAQASIPLLIFLYIRFLKHPNPLILAAVFFYPVLSEFPRYGIFICGLLTLAFIYFLSFDRKYALRAFGVLVVLTLGYVATDYRIFRLMMLSDATTIRTDFSIPPQDFLKTTIEAFLYSQYHAQSKHFYIVLPTVFLGFLFLINYRSFANGFRDGVKSNLKLKEVQVYLILLSAAVGFSVVYGFYFGTTYKDYLTDLIPQLAGFNFSRFIWLNPFIWHFLFLLSLIAIARRMSPHVACIVALAQLLYVTSSPSYGNDVVNTVDCELFSDCSSSLTYSQFYSPDLFEKVKESISYNDELVVAFGFHPAVLTYNGFFTADGYHNAYSIDYKREFRKLISPALDVSERYRDYFDNWGGRAYLFSPEVGYQPSTKLPKISVGFPVDPKQLRAMKIRYVLSLYEFDSDTTEFLSRVGAFTSEGSPYNVHVYRVRYETQ